MAKKNKNVRFIRKNGRIIPIRIKNPNRKELREGLAKTAAGAGVLGLGASSSTKNLKRSFKFFRKGAEFRGLSKLAARGSKTRNTFIRKAAKQKVFGKANAKIARTKLGFSLAAGSLLVSSGITDMFAKNIDARDEIGNVVGGVAAAATVGLVARKFKVRARDIQNLFSGFSRRGQSLSRKKFSKIAKTGLKKRAKKGSQLKFKFDE